MLKNISVGYDPLEDRLMLRLSMQGSDGDIEHALLLTRRVCAAWRQDLQAMVDVSAQAPERLDPVAKAAVSSAHHQAMSSQVPQVVAPRPALTPQSDQAPALVTRVMCGRRRSDRRWVLKFERHKLPEMTLILSTPTLHALVDAVSRRIQATAWNLPVMPSEQWIPSPTASAALH